MPHVPERVARQRRCLLKGCEANFKPSHPLSRYCSDACRHAAKKWAQQRANRRYRGSLHGKQTRREQAARYRRRVKERETVSTEVVRSGWEGYKSLEPDEKYCCRPGCYEIFKVTSRSPLKRFCNSDCRRALRAVLVREKRWRQNLPPANDSDQFVHERPDRH